MLVSSLKKNSDVLQNLKTPTMLFVGTNLKVTWQRIRDRINFNAVLRNRSGNSSNAFLLERHLLPTEAENSIPRAIHVHWHDSQENVSSIMEFLLPF